jgi:16S rRNA (uracil1498-N3)-methyltransferase
MRVVRIHVDMPLAAGVEVTLPPQAAHHLTTVLRLGPGTPLELFDGSGGSYRGHIVAARKRSAIVEIESFDARERESPLALTLVQGISRGQHMDYTLQKAVELGVARVVPVMTGHGNVRFDGARAARRTDHWRRVAIAACEQCGRNRIPEVAAPRPLAQWIEEDRSPCRLVFHPDAHSGLAALPAPGGAVSLLFGPEGGLSGTEVRLANNSGWESVRLGPRVLRTETAPVAALAACQALWGDLR